MGRLILFTPFALIGALQIAALYALAPLAGPAMHQETLLQDSSDTQVCTLTIDQKSNVINGYL